MLCQPENERTRHTPSQDGQDTTKLAAVGTYDHTYEMTAHVNIVTQ